MNIDQKERMTMAADLLRAGGDPRRVVLEGVVRSGGRLWEEAVFPYLADRENYHYVRVQNTDSDSTAFKADTEACKLGAREGVRRADCDFILWARKNLAQGGRRNSTGRRGGVERIHMIKGPMRS